MKFLNNNDVIGYVFGETRVDELSFLAKKPPKVGDYVIINYNDNKILGMVESTILGSRALDGVSDVEYLEKIKDFVNDTYYIKGKIKVLGDIENLKLPRIPPEPGTPIYLADKETLKRVFGNGHIKIGHLITREDIEVKLDVNKLCSRHLAILAMTGMGKSNTVSILLKELSKLRATILVFDMHGEYVNIKCNSQKIPINIIHPKINVYEIDDERFCDLAGIDRQATKQRPYVQKAIHEVKNNKKQSDFANVEEYLDEIISVLERYLDENEKDKSSIQTAIFRIEHMKHFKKKILTINYNPVKDIKEHHVNILPLESLDEYEVDVVVSYLSKSILDSRKELIIENRELAKPIFLIFEEAHLIVPKNRDTEAKRYLGRIAREGRKFGVGLCLVSQRPKGLDADVLSQCSNLIISKLIEPSDQKHVQAASEALSDDLMKQLTSLNIGEAIILGPCVKVPALVKIDEFDGERGGEDLDLVKLWSREEEKKDFDDNIFGDDDF